MLWRLLAAIRICIYSSLNVEYDIPTACFHTAVINFCLWPMAIKSDAAIEILIEKLLENPKLLLDIWVSFLFSFHRCDFQWYMWHVFYQHRQVEGTINNIAAYFPVDNIAPYFLIACTFREALASLLRLHEIDTFTVSLQSPNGESTSGRSISPHKGSNYVESHWWILLTMDSNMESFSMLWQHHVINKKHVMTIYLSYFRWVYCCRWAQWDMV